MTKTDKTKPGSKGQGKAKSGSGKPDKKHAAEKLKANTEALPSIIPEELSRMLGKKATKKLRKAFDAALMSELESAVESTARRWARESFPSAWPSSVEAPEPGPLIAPSRKTRIQQTPPRALFRTGPGLRALAF